MLRVRAVEGITARQAAEDEGSEQQDGNSGGVSDAEQFQGEGEGEGEDDISDNQVAGGGGAPGGNAGENTGAEEGNAADDADAASAADAEFLASGEQS